MMQLWKNWKKLLTGFVLDEISNICLSGGAEGSDLMWGMTSGMAGQQVRHFSFKGHRTLAPDVEVVELTQEQLDIADEYLVRADKTLKRWYPGKRSLFVKNLLRRNYYQIAWADAVYAVAALDKKECVTGGTGWAVQMFIDRHDAAPCSAYVYDQEQGSWYKWEASWVAIDRPPVPTGVWAGIGSRELKPNGKAAIRDLMGYTPSVQVA